MIQITSHALLFADMCNSWVHLFISQDKGAQYFLNENKRTNHRLRKQNQTRSQDKGKLSWEIVAGDYDFMNREEIDGDWNLKNGETHVCAC
jgi:hypothetical protein